MATALSVSSLAEPAPAQAQLSSLGGSSSADLKALSDFFASLLRALGNGGGGTITPPSIPGQTVTRTVTVAGKQRTYHVVLPLGHNRGTSYPVIMGFGGWQHDASRARSYEQFERAAGSRAIVVYPEPLAGSDGVAWAGAPYAYTTINEEITFTRAIINDLAANYSGDRNSVYAAGLSNGGGMALAIGCHAPNLVAGVAGVAGAYYNPTVANCSPKGVKTLIMHADNDHVVDYKGGVRHGAAYRGVPYVYHQFGSANRCDMSPMAPRRVGNTDIWEPRRCTTPVKLMKVYGGGHTWFNNPSATNEVVNFFLN